MSGAWDFELGPGPQIKNLRRGSCVVADAIYLTVRDPQWNTIEGSLVESAGSGANPDLRLQQRWRFEVGGGLLDVQWELVVAGNTVTARFSAACDVELAFNRLGLCVLHPLELCGTRVDVDGHAPYGGFPGDISPIPVFSGFTNLTYTTGGLTVRLDCHGERFETEDHRNWSDAGWKSYSPPLAEPAPFLVAPGDHRQGELTLTASGHCGSGPGACLVEVGRGSDALLPALGCLAGPEAPPAWAQFTLVELVAGRVGRSRLDAAAASARAAGKPLDATLSVDEVEAREWSTSLAGSGVRRALLVARDTHCSTATLVKAGAGELAVGAGTRGYFAELHRHPGGYPTGQFLQFSVASEVHHTEIERVLDTVRALPVLTEQGLRLAAGRALRIGPVTLAQRFSVHAAADDEYAPWSAEFPPERRSSSPFVGVWALGVVAGAVGAAEVVLQAFAPPRDAAVGRLLGQIGSRAGSRVVEVRVSDPRTAVALAVADQAQIALWVGNLRSQASEVHLLHCGGEHSITLEPYEVRRLALDATGTSIRTVAPDDAGSGAVWEGHSDE